MGRMWIDGLDVLGVRLGKSSKALRKETLELAVLAGAHVALKHAVATKKFKNVTGNLRSSLHAEAAAISDTKAEAYIGTNVTYAKYIELGTSRMAPRAFLLPALTDHEREIEREVNDVILIQLERAAA